MFGGNENAFTLVFGPKLADQCALDTSTHALTCGVMPPATATLRGTVTNTANDQALAACEGAMLELRADNTSNDGSSLYHDDTDDLGNYVFHNLAVDPYGCVADPIKRCNRRYSRLENDDAGYSGLCVGLLAFQVSQGNRHASSDGVFDLLAAAGYTFEPNGSSSRYEHLMEQYFKMSAAHRSITCYRNTTTIRAAQCAMCHARRVVCGYRKLSAAQALDPIHSMMPISATKSTTYKT